MQLGELELRIPKINIEPCPYIHDFQTRLYVQYADIVEKTDAGHAIVKLLSEDPRVIALNGKMISRGSGAQRFEIKTLAMWFLWCANEYGFENAKTHLDSFLDLEEVSVINALWVLGIEVDQPIILSDEYTLQPVDHMPDSRDKEYFLQSRFGYVVQNTPVPACAITKPCRVQKTWAMDPPVSAKGNQEFREVSSRLYDIALILNALNGISCVPYYSTSYVTPTTPLGHFGGSGGGSSVYDVLAHGSAKLSSESKSSIETLLTMFDKLSGPERARIQRILNRLSQAKRRVQVEDKILDLGIALEMLLLEDNPNYDQLALSFRLRGSWLLGKSPEDRIKKHQQLKEIYEYRSQVAHSGVLCKGVTAEIERVQQSFSDYQSLAEDICQKIIKEGKPAWSRLVLGVI
jgi:hypothetical protein